MPDSKPTGREIICRFDMIELFIKTTRNNLNHFESIRGDFVNDLWDLVRKPSKEYLQGKRIRQDFVNEVVQIILRRPIEYTKNDLLRIRIVNPQKWEWQLHHGYVRAVGDLLYKHHIDYGVSKSEIAFDTLDEKIAREFATSFLIKWGRPNKLFNYEKGKKKIGGSSNGDDEYMFRRESGRQTHSYVRRYPISGLDGMKKEEKIYRLELRFTRKHLRRNAIESIDDLFAKARLLVENSISFKILDRRRLNREIHRAKDWRLAGKSGPEQFRMLLRNGLLQEEILRYFVPVPPAQIYFPFDDKDSGLFSNPLGFALWGEYINLIKNRSHNKGVN